MTPPPTRTDLDPGAQASDADVPIGPGSISGAVLGDFRVEGLLGRGGMGEVYLARQLSLGRLVALKVLRPEALDGSVSLARFEAEAATAARLNHPNIVHVYSVGGEGTARYIAMEYVPGWTLRAYLEKKGRPELRLAFSIMRQAAMAVGAAGEVGLVHRDIKPENLLLTRKGVVKVADFGLCRDQGASRPDLTLPGIAVGTPHYMSPEQVQGLPLDHRSDLYSLGITFYQLLAGVLPFPGQAALAVAMKQVHETPPSLAVHRPDLPEELVALVMRLLAKDPADRYQRADDLLVDLARARDAAAGQISPGDGTAGGRVETLPSGTFGLTLVLDDHRPVLARTPVAPAPQRAWSRAPILAVAGGLALGVLAGWLGRGEDLLSGGSGTVAGPPGLWMVPSLAAVRPRALAEAQYRYAQIEAPAAERVAAWLAVPSRFPEQKDHDWAFLAYIQLVRQFLKAGDRDRLVFLAAELARAGPEDEKLLAKVAHAGVAAIDGQAGEVNATLTPLVSVCRAAPPLAALALDVTSRAMRGTPGQPAPAFDLTSLRNGLEKDLGLHPELARRPPRPG